MTPQNAKTTQESFAQTMESVSAASASEYDHQDQFLPLFKILNLFSNLPKQFYVTHTQLLLHINHVEYHDLDDIIIILIVRCKSGHVGNLCECHDQNNLCGDRGVPECTDNRKVIMIIMIMTLMIPDGQLDN